MIRHILKPITIKLAAAGILSVAASLASAQTSNIINNITNNIDNNIDGNTSGADRTTFDGVYNRTFKLNHVDQIGNVMSSNTQAVTGNVNSSINIQNIQAGKTTVDGSANGNVMGGTGVHGLVNGSQTVSTTGSVESKVEILGAQTQFASLMVTNSAAGNVMQAVFKESDGAFNNASFASGNTQFMAGNVNATFTWNEDPSGTVNISNSATGNVLVRGIQK
jgi:hypothetical protein